MPSLGEAIARGIASAQADLFVSCPGQIVTPLDPIEGTCDVRLMVRRPMLAEDDSTVHEELPIIPGVPLLFPYGAGASITWDVLPGDVCMIFATSYAMQQWLATGQLSDAGDVRQHHPGSCFALPFVHRKRQVPALVPGSVFLGSPLATEPATLGARNAAWLDAVITAIGLLGGAVVPPDPVNNATPADTLSSSVKVAL